MSATPLVERNAAGEVFVTIPADDYLRLSTAAATWSLYAAARAIDRALATQLPTLPPGARASWRRGTWA